MISAAAVQDVGAEHEGMRCTTAPALKNIKNKDNPIVTTWNHLRFAGLFPLLCGPHQASRQGDCRYQAAVLRNALPSDVERGAVIN